MKTLLGNGQILFLKRDGLIDRFQYIRQVSWAFDEMRFAVKSSTIFPEKDGKILSFSTRLRTAYLHKEKFLEFIDASSLEAAQ